jgi:hypothetical protein
MPIFTEHLSYHMRKEILYAIFAGAVFGIIIAFGVWRANTALEPETKTSNEARGQATPAPSTDEFEIALAKPDNHDVITESPALVSGVTSPLTWVSISGEDEDYIVKSDETGKFEQDVDLEGGVNQIVITAFSEEGEKVEENLLVVYSTQFEE